MCSFVWGCFAFVRQVCVSPAQTEWNACARESFSSWHTSGPPLASFRTTPAKQSRNQIKLQRIRARPEKRRPQVPLPRSLSLSPTPARGQAESGAHLADRHDGSLESETGGNLLNSATSGSMGMLAVGLRLRHQKHKLKTVPNYTPIRKIRRD